MQGPNGPATVHPAADRPTGRPTLTSAWTAERRGPSDWTLNGPDLGGRVFEGRTSSSTASGRSRPTRGPRAVGPAPVSVRPVPPTPREPGGVQGHACPARPADRLQRPVADDPVETQHRVRGVAQRVGDAGVHKLVVERLDGEQIGEGKDVTERRGAPGGLVQDDRVGAEAGVKPGGEVAEEGSRYRALSAELRGLAVPWIRCTIRGRRCGY